MILIGNSVVDGRYSIVIYTLSSANLEGSYPFSVEPIRVWFCEINKYTVSSISIYITDVCDTIININGVDVSFSFIRKDLKLSYVRLS